VSFSSVLPDVAWIVWASFVPSASSWAQFFEVANFGVPALEVVVEAVVHRQELESHRPGRV
jgi:hypothetical protein